MRRFLILLLIFLSPFLLICGVVTIVDPYGLFRANRNQEKRECALSMDHGILSYPVEYKREPQPNLIIGESRANINLTIIPEEGWSKFSFGGAPTPAYLKSFWFAAKQGKLKKVILIMDTYSYISAMNMGSDAFEVSEDMIDHPYKYFTSKLVLETCYKYLTTSKEQVNKTIRTDTAFWNQQIEHGRSMCTAAVMNKQLFMKTVEHINLMLKDIKEYCDTNDIEIIIVSPSVSVDLINVFCGAGDCYSNAMRSLVDIFGYVLDFGYSNVFTNNPENYKDPFHLRDFNVYVRGIWEGDTTLYRTINRNNIETIISESCKQRQ